jgi:hypothetical protein
MEDMEVSQVNVNPSGRETGDTGDRSAAAGINLITVLIVLAALALVAWFLFTGPLRAVGGGGTTNINVNPPAQQQAPNVNVNPPGQQQAPSQPGSKP